jgi:hypothetical protein
VVGRVKRFGWMRGEVGETSDGFCVSFYMHRERWTGAMAGAVTSAVTSVIVTSSASSCHPPRSAWYVPVFGWFPVQCWCSWTRRARDWCAWFTSMTISLTTLCRCIRKTHAAAVCRLCRWHRIGPPRKSWRILRACKVSGLP